MTTSSIQPSQGVLPPMGTGQSAQQTMAPQNQSGERAMAQPFPAAAENGQSMNYRAGAYGSSAVQGGALPPPSQPALAPAPAPVTRSAQAPSIRPASEKVAMLPRGDARTGYGGTRTLGAPAPRAAEANTASGGTYVVKSGDTLTRIASSAGVSIDALKQANGLSNASIRIGQRLRLPAGSRLTASAEPERRMTMASAPKPAAVAPKIETPKVTAVAQPAPAASAAPAVRTAEAKPQPPVAANDGSQSVSTDARAGAEMASLTPQSSGIGKLRWPVRGQVVSKYGSREDGHRNDGIDISVPEGTPVKAAENGVVIYAGNGLKEYGNTVLIRHDNGMVTVYGYAKDLKVKRGDKVTRGDVIADSGMSGAAQRPKLHFEVRKDASPVDPLTYLD